MSATRIIISSHFFSLSFSCFLATPPTVNTEEEQWWHRSSTAAALWDSEELPNDPRTPLSHLTTFLLLSLLMCFALVMIILRLNGHDFSAWVRSGRFAHIHTLTPSQKHTHTSLLCFALVMIILWLNGHDFSAWVWKLQTRISTVTIHTYNSDVFCSISLYLWCWCDVSVYWFWYHLASFASRSIQIHTNNTTQRKHKNTTTHTCIYLNYIMFS